MDINEILCWSNGQLYEELKSRGQKVGPIGESTKKLYAMKLLKLLAAEKELASSTTVGEGQTKETVPNPQVTKVKRSKRASSIGAASTRKSRAIQSKVEEYAAGDTVTTLETNVEQVVEKLVPEAPMQVQLTETPPLVVAAPKPEETEQQQKVPTPKLAPYTAGANWGNSSGTPGRSRAEILRNSVQKRRSLHPDTPTVDKAAVTKTAVTAKENVAPVKGKKFCTLSKLYVTVGVVLFFWLVYSVMESNPSNLSLL